MISGTTWAVGVSGSGSIAATMYHQGLRPDLVLADTECLGLEYARELGIPTLLLPTAGVFRDGRCDARREEYTEAVVAAFRHRGIELFVMSGLMTVFSQAMSDYLRWNWVNTHPALLPSFPGAHAVRDALRYGVRVTGTTQHIATATVDHGPVLMQEAVTVPDFPTSLPFDECVEAMQLLIKIVERRNYPAVVRRILTGEINLRRIWETSQLVSH